MGYLGKALIGAVVGVGAIAAAPFTGGGSLFAGATLMSSLAGAGVAAGIAGLGGAAVGAVAQGVQDEFKEEEIKEAKEASFVDGINEGKAQSVEEIKRYADFYLATTALSYYIARCDGGISAEEQLEIDYDLEAIKKNVDISDAVKNEIVRLMTKKDLTFDEVEMYLNEVSVRTLEQLGRDIDEIIEASDGISPDEQRAKERFVSYVERRKADE